MNDADVIIVGAGLSGLACARELQGKGLDTMIVESGSRVGGRIGTDENGGFLLDRGFQVLQTWYPEARRALEYAALDLRSFYPGALVRYGGRFHRVSDVWRRPWSMREMLGSPVGSLGDKLRLMLFRQRSLGGDLHGIYDRHETSTRDFLLEFGFSERMMKGFFIPFFAGVFFEPELGMSRRAFEFTFRAFALGDTALPAKGMQAIPAQLAAHLADDSVKFESRVTRLEPGRVTTSTGQTYRAKAVVVATDCVSAAKLLNKPEPATRGTSCFHFAADRSPLDEPILVLNAEGEGPVNSLLCPSSLSPHYAPEGAALITVNVFGVVADLARTEDAIRKQLRRWYGPGVDLWRRIAVYRIPNALPAQGPLQSDPSKRSLRIEEGLWCCSELCSAASIHWALHTGRRAGSEIASCLVPERVGVSGG
jgi:phytoene dehydrogenase-like protein